MTFAPVEPIAADHLTDEFDCGSEAQTLWLRKFGLQAHRTDSSRVYVVTKPGDRQVVGYYALSAGSVEHAGAPPRVTKGMARYPIPVVTLTRLGVDRSNHGQGLGRALLKDAILRVAGASEVIGARALLVHCEDESAKGFYSHFGFFDESPTDPLHLFMLMGDLRKTLDP